MPESNGENRRQETTYFDGEDLSSSGTQVCHSLKCHNLNNSNEKAKQERLTSNYCKLFPIKNPVKNPTIQRMPSGLLVNIYNIAHFNFNFSCLNNTIKRQLKREAEAVTRPLAQVILSPKESKPKQ
jgi:hypothetical protein